MTRSGINVHLTHTQKNRKLQSEQYTNYANKGYYYEYKRKSRWNYSQYLDKKDDPNAKDV